MKSEKVLDLWAFQRFNRQRQDEKMTAKIAPWKHIKRNVHRVEKTYKSAEKEAKSLQQKHRNIEQYIGHESPEIQKPPTRTHI